MKKKYVTAVCKIYCLANDVICASILGVDEDCDNINLWGDFSLGGLK